MKIPLTHVVRFNCPPQHSVGFEELETLRPWPYVEFALRDPQYHADGEILLYYECECGFIADPFWYNRAIEDIPPTPLHDMRTHVELMHRLEART